VSRPVGWRPIDRISFRFGGLDAPEPMHETLLVTPRDIFGGDQLDVGQVAQQAAPEW
jgi:hypothetical protein